MTRSIDPASLTRLRWLAQLSILFSMAMLLATAGALMLLPNSVALGQWILIAIGVASSAAAFVFGVLISLHRPHARRAGFVAVAATLPAIVLFGLLAYVVPESAWIFGTWALVLLAYATTTSGRLVRWPTGDAADEPKSPLAIFISYRRLDSGETVGRIHDHLLEAFEEERVFLDVDDQVGGEDYRRVIERALDRTDVVLAVIGTHWLDVTDREGRRRLDNPDDLVRIELETALAKSLKVVPLLVEGAPMPAAADVPPSLRPLCYRTAMPVRPDPDFPLDIRRLVQALRAAGEEPRGAADPSA